MRVAGLRLLVDRVVVHDRQLGRADERAAARRRSTATCRRRARCRSRDGWAGRCRPRAPSAAGTLRIDASICRSTLSNAAARREAGEQIHLTAVRDVRGAHHDVADALQRALIRRRCTPRARRAWRVSPSTARKPRARHRARGDLLDGAPARLIDRLQQHVVRLPRLPRGDLRRRVHHVPAFRKLQREAQHRMEEARCRARCRPWGCRRRRRPRCCARNSSRFRADASAAADFAASGCASTTRAPGSGCVDSQLGTPRSLSSSIRASVCRKRGTRGRVPAALAPRTRCPADPTRARRPARTSGTRRRAPSELRSPNGCVAGTKMLEHGEPEAAAGRARVLLRGVPRRDVPDLMAQHAGQLGLVVQIRQDAARDVDEAAGQRERVDRRMIDDGERPRQVRPMRQRARAAARCRRRSAAARDRRRRPSRGGPRRRLCWPIAISCASLMSESSRLPVTGLVAQAAERTASAQTDSRDGRARRWGQSARHHDWSTRAVQRTYHPPTID